MKKLIMVLLMWCTGCTVVKVENPVITKSESPIKIDYATEGEKVEISWYQDSKFSCPDEYMSFAVYPGVPKFEKVGKSIVLSYSFKIDSRAKECLTNGFLILEVIDSELNIIRTRTISVTQFDTLARFFIFFKDKSFDSSKYFIQLRTNINKDQYVTSLAHLPSRFKP